MKKKQKPKEKDKLIYKMLYFLLIGSTIIFLVYQKWVFGVVGLLLLLRNHLLYQKLCYDLDMKRLMKGIKNV